MKRLGRVTLERKGTKGHTERIKINDLEKID